MSVILMTEEYWASSPYSIARYTGGVRIDGVDYVIVNKEGKDLYECRIEAERARREKAIKPGEPADLLDVRYKDIYRKLGRDKFIAWVKEGLDLAGMKKRLKEEKSISSISSTKVNEQELAGVHLTIN